MSFPYLHHTKPTHLFDIGRQPIYIIKIYLEYNFIGYLQEYFRFEPCYDDHLNFKITKDIEKSLKFSPEYACIEQLNKMRRYFVIYKFEKVQYTLKEVRRCKLEKINNND